MLHTSQFSPSRPATVRIAIAIFQLPHSTPLSTSRLTVRHVAPPHCHLPRLPPPLPRLLIRRSCQLSHLQAVVARVNGRSDRNVPAILPSPYCLLLSNQYYNSTGSHYALDVKDGRVAWQWPAAPLGHFTQPISLQPSAAPDRVYALANFERDHGQVNASMCGVMAALHSATGKPIWQYELCFPSVDALQAFTLLQSNGSTSAAGERIVFTSGGSNTLAYARVDVLNGTTGKLLSSVTLSKIEAWSVQTVGTGADGYFTMERFDDVALPSLCQLTPDSHVQLVTATPIALNNSLLYTQPALRYNHSTDSTRVTAHDVATDKQLWASGDSFLVGTDWGSNDTFNHYSTSYQTLDTHPNAFLVLNTAFDNNQTVVAQVGLYHLSNGKSVAHSPVLTFDRLFHPYDNPTIWLFAQQQLLLLRGDTVWYTLHVTTLNVVQHGHYATSDAACSRTIGWSTRTARMWRCCTAA